ncbi:MAG: DEAD/DEAH box helicase [Candidatus Nealsonbacteria bacterium DGGOD1a]|nr:MAG: DEAD/DEAH box helicase [Candidatus Nealsonbacteria bacterium DGGOD1a]
MKSRLSSFGSRPRRFNAGKFGAKRGGGSRGNNFRGARIDPAKFVNKAIGQSDPAGEKLSETKFCDFEVDKQLKQRIADKGYVNATPIQAKAIPQILKGIDVVGIADTGTGKTAAFLVPLINKVLGNRKAKVLIVAPTRELAAQTDQELKNLAKGLKIFSVCCVGGTSVSRQMSELRYFNNFIIGTPGRLKDLIDRKRINLAEFSTIVLDEADRMLDMGFINDMRFLMAGMPQNRQTLFFSATLSPEIDRLIGEFLRDPVKISIKTRDTSQNVEQDVVKINGRNKTEVLRELLAREEFSKVLIFGRTKHGVENLCKTLEKNGFKTESIHGDKNYSRRVKSLELFKQDRIQVLVATDVAARGLDIANVSHVINYDLPQSYEDYIHRIGRTGRGNQYGKALTFID